MNINLKITIPFKNSAQTLSLEAPTMLTPFFITERELLTVYLEDWSPRLEQSAREIIFYASIKAEETLRLKLKAIPNEELYSLKRQLTQCLATVAFGNRHNTDFIKSMSRSKTLADFTVSTTIANDTSFLSNILKDAQLCVNDMLSIIEELNSGDSAARLFVKGQLSPTTYTSDRLWWHRNLSVESTETFASTKTLHNGRLFKNGGKGATKS